MSDIKLFVSHRIDRQSELIDNPLYIPVRCGAVYDRENPQGLQGDDSGDHISEKRMSFCELTVQYWAWKNTRAEYCGLCHYRRYLSFADRRFRPDRYGMIHVPCMLPEDKERFGLLDREAMEKRIRASDALLPETADVRRLPLKEGRRADCVRDWWEAQSGEYFPAGSVGLAMELTRELKPEYADAAADYLAGARFRSSNCYILRRELFEALCDFEFPILFALEEKLASDARAAAFPRTVGYIGEILFGIFAHRLCAEGNCRVRERQLVYFRSADRIRSAGEARRKRLLRRAEGLVRPASELLFPIGSRRREFIKIFRGKS